MSNQPEIDRLTIKVATLEANLKKWGGLREAAILESNMVGAREAQNEARLAYEELFDAKRELRKLELSR